MNKKLLVAFILFVLVSSVSVAGSLPPYREGELLVRFGSAGYGLDSPTEVQRAAARQQVLDSAGGGTVVRLYKRIPGWALVRLPAGLCVESVLVRYASTPGIMLAAPNYKIQLFRVPNDPYFGLLWGMQNTGQSGGSIGADISAADAWDLETGSSEIVVAVTDTGVDYTHPDLQANMWVNEDELYGMAGFDDDGNGYIDDIYGCDFAGTDINDLADDDGDPMDTYGHGTHVAGTIGAVGNNGMGVVGVCWDVRIMALRMFDDSVGSSDAAAMAAIEYAIDNGAKVINASWGGPGYSPGIRDEIAAARDAGIVFVASAGNGGDDLVGDNIDFDAAYPAAYPLDNIIAVMATTDRGTQASYSNYGLQSVDLAAPGGEFTYLDPDGQILSTWAGGGYAYDLGTSMAAPHVSGACALLLSLDPQLSYAEIKDALMNNVDQTADLNGRCVSGGRLNVGAAVMEVAIDDDPPTPNPARWAYTGTLEWGRPKATGPHSIAMEVKKADDRGEVEYYFGCLTDSALDSGWQSAARYVVTGLDEATEYTFRVRARDDANNYTGWSVESSATTGSGADSLSPFPDPAVWEAGPQIVRLTPLILTMRAKPASDESSVQYRFEAYATSDTSDPNTAVAVRDWDNDTLWRPSGGSFVVGSRYWFKFIVRDQSTNQNKTAYSSTLSLLIRQGPKILPVPSHYSTIEAAINAAVKGDVVVISPGEYHDNPGDVNLWMKSGITVRSIDPNDPTVVASTVIDCRLSTRGFNFKNILDPNTTIAGLTIRNGIHVGRSGLPGDPCGLKAEDGGDGVGGGIWCYNSSPTILNCVLQNCFAIGGPAGDPSGGLGGAAGNSYGGGIYCDNTSAPIIRGCEITGCGVIDGISTDGLHYGKAYGGGIYIKRNTLGKYPVIEDCTITGCKANADNGGEALGGGIYHGLSSIPVSITRTRVIGYNIVIGPNDFSASHGGGGIYLAAGGKGATISDCEVSFNIAGEQGIADGDGGGILYPNGLAVTISDGSVISRNQCRGKGGGIFAGKITLSTTLNIYDSFVLDNSARFGGGIYLDQTNFTAVDSEIADNVAEEGAGINAAVSKFTMSGSRIAGNSAGQGPGIGGGMALWNSTGRFVNCLLRSNSAEGSHGLGGGIYLSGYDSMPKEFVNCLITDNIASEEGAGLFCHFGAWVDMNNCTIADNDAAGHSGSGGGISCAEYAAYVQLRNSIVYGNDARYGPQLALGRPSGSILDPYALVDVEYSDVQGGEDDVFIENPAAVAVYFFGGNWDEADPFASFDVNESSYYLKHTAAGQTLTSNLVDAGLGQASDLEAAVGIELTTRTDGVMDTGTVDIGYHYPAAESTGTYRLTIRIQREGDFDADGVLIAEGFGFDSFAARNDANTKELKRGTVVRLTAVPDPCFLVSYWTGADNWPNTGDPCNTVTMNANKEVTVSFQPDGMYSLITAVTTDNGRMDYIDSSGHRQVHLGRTLHSAGEIIKLIAVPDDKTHVPRWDGADNDYTIAFENTVTMDDNRYVTVGFNAPRILYVGQDSQYQIIQRALDDAEPGDIVMIAPGTWNIYEASGGADHLSINGKDITVTGVDADVPESTVILGRFVITDVTRRTVIQGLTITGNYHYADNEAPDDPAGADGYPGRPEHGGGMCLHNVGYFPLWAKTDSGSPTVRNCVFLNCSVTGTNGTEGVAGDTENYFFYGGGNGGWGSWAHGGAVSCGPDSNPLFENCIFQDCNAVGGDGGNGADGDDTDGIMPGFGGNWGDETSPIWEYGPFLPYWKYSGYGGAVYIDSNCAAEFKNCRFSGNTVHGGSCGISGMYGDVSISGWPYQHYRIDRFGGAVYAAAESRPSFVDCNFVNNYGSVDPCEHIDGTESVPAYENLTYGGALAFEDGAEVKLERCSFSDNTAHVGAGVYCTYSDSSIKDCNFAGNSAYHGGGIICIGGFGRVDNCRFTGNTATIAGAEGGAIACLGADADIINTQIIGNYSQGSGGGLYVSSRGIDGNAIGSWNVVNVKNCLIAENIAGLTGAGISSNWHAFSDVRLCTIAGNQVLEGGYGGGLYSSNGNYTVLENSIIWGNYAGNGKQIAVRPSDRPAAVMVNYSDIQGGTVYIQPPSTGGNVWVDQGCFFPGPGESIGNIGAGIYDNPLFVSGLLGKYYLSQIATGDPAQTKNSPCVDTGSKNASADEIKMDERTTRTDRVPDRLKVDMGFHYPLERIGARCRVCDLVLDGIIDYLDLEAWVAQREQLPDDCSDENGWCAGADFNFDGVVNDEDYSVIALCYGNGAQDTQPPVPNPMTWRIAPYSTSQSQIVMGAEKAYDAWGWEVEYYFECITDPNHDRGWSTDPNYTDTGLTSGKQYAYRVRARDGRDPANYTQWSVIAGAVVGADTTPPTPNPMTWQIPPQALSADTITMTASVATDSSGVEYGFWNLNTGAVVWQNDRQFLNTGLDFSVTYTYRAAARDKSVNQNTTAWSVPASATTTAAPNEPNGGGFDSFAPVTGVYADVYKAAFASVPTEVLLTNGYHHQMTAVTATDQTPPVQYRFICVTDSRFSSGWQISPSYDVLVSAFQSRSSWIWQVVTRDSALPTPNVGTMSDYYNCRGQSYPYP